MTAIDDRGGPVSSMGGAMRGLMRGMPPTAREQMQNARKMAREKRAVIPPTLSASYGVESSDEAAEREMRQAAGRIAQWRVRLPKRYENAQLSDVTAEQDPKSAIREWLDSPHLSLILAGEADRGKSHAAFAVGNEAVRRGKWVVYWTLADLLAHLRPDGLGGSGHPVLDCDILVLDDVGREKLSDFGLEQLQRLLDARNRERLRCVFTTNLPYQQKRDDAGTPTGEQGLMERYGSPIVGRMMDDAVAVKVEGPSRRSPAPW